MVRCQYHGGTTLTDNVPRKHGKMMLLSSSVPGSVMNTPETPQSRPACTPPRCTACRAFAHNAELNFLLSGVLYVCGPWEIARYLVYSTKITSFERELFGERSPPSGWYLESIIPKYVQPKHVWIYILVKHIHLTWRTIRARAPLSNAREDKDTAWHSTGTYRGCRLQPLPASEIFYQLTCAHIPRMELVHVGNSHKIAGVSLPSI